MSRAHKQRSKTFNSLFQSLSHAHSGGAGDVRKRNRPARFFSVHDHKPRLFWINHSRSDQANDNAAMDFPGKGMMTRFMIAAICFSVAAGIVLTTSDTSQTLPNEHVMSELMDANPDMVAALLNNVSVGD